MEEKTAGDPADSDGAAGDLFGLPDLPSLTKRWTVRRKAAVNCTPFRPDTGLSWRA